MVQRKVRVQRVVSADGRAIAEASSEVMSDEAQVHQTVTVHVFSSSGSGIGSVSVSSSASTSRNI